MKNKSITLPHRGLKIHDRLTRRPTFEGIVTVGKSQTIPGQAVTPQQLMRWKASGEKAPDHVYMDYDVYHFNKMDKLEQIDYIRELGDMYKVNEDSAREKIKEINTKIEEEKIKKLKIDAIKEFKNQNATTTNDDANQ